MQYHYISNRLLYPQTMLNKQQTSHFTILYSHMYDCFMFKEKCKNIILESIFLREYLHAQFIVIVMYICGEYHCRGRYPIMICGTFFRGTTVVFDLDQTMMMMMMNPKLPKLH